MKLYKYQTSNVYQAAKAARSISRKGALVFRDGNVVTVITDAPHPDESVLSNVEKYGARLIDFDNAAMVYIVWFQTTIKDAARAARRLRKQGFDVIRRCGKQIYVRHNLRWQIENALLDYCGYGISMLAWV